ncbi:MAG: protein-L-isoaspartate O-methyltransferase [Micavibrio aeruginosavorus]|uniref:Protein-L-isoaspartate O-methyltransferase n=1 Tax=Micavibrio aeruginosavorus TaxID=349221 RepID=A0A2W5N5H6_9BACT|nr:MAG: protein-L-isoaspartate O-methyltransferase [Micavibrio aeruginosavorus]
MTPFRTKKQELIAHLRERSNISDERVLSAIESVPREEFVMESMHHAAWDDISLPIEEGQTISQPTVVATMTQALELTDRHKVLEIGTGSGYQAAILSRLCRRVYTIERHKPLLDSAEKLFKTLDLGNITTICADGMKGWPRIHGQDQHPFDRVIVTCAAREAPPPALIDQLAIGGVMVIPIGPPGEQMLRRYQKESEETYSYRNIMPVRFVPLLPDVNKGDKKAKKEAAEVEAA